MTASYMLQIRLIFIAYRNSIATVDTAADVQMQEN